MDHAIQFRKSLIASADTPETLDASADAQIKRCSDSLAAKRIRAINTLGNRWVLHPEYDYSKNAHHSPTYKGSAVLSVFLHLSGAVSSGRV